MLSNQHQIVHPTMPKNSTHTFYSYIIKTPKPSHLLAESLRARGIDAPYYEAITQLCVQNSEAYPHARQTFATALEIPFHRLKTKEDLKNLAEKIKEAVRTTP